MMKQRVAYVFRTGGFGGAELMLVTLLQHLNRSRFDPVVYLYCTNRPAEERVRAALAPIGVPVHPMDQDGVPRAAGGDPHAANTAAASSAPSSRQVAKTALLRLLPGGLKMAGYYRRRIREATDRLREARIDIIHFLHGGYPSLTIPMIASRRAGIPVRIADVLLDPRPMTSPDIGLVRGLFVWRAGRGMTHVRAMSRRMQQRLIRLWGVPRPRICVIGNWVDIDRFDGLNGAAQCRTALGLPRQAKLVTVAARLSPEKGHAVLFEAAARLRGGYPDVHYLLAGEGPLRQELESLTERLALRDVVHFLGFRDDIPQLMSASDLILLPSLAEGVPGTVLEGMAAGKPVIATDVGGVAEVLQDGQTGRVVPPGDAAALARALEEMLGAEPAVLARMGEQARRQVTAQHDVDSVLAKLFALYDEGAVGP